MAIDECEHKRVKVFEDEQGQPLYLCLDCKEWIEIKTSLAPFEEDDEDDIQQI
jgi:hypothetical protein